MKKKLLSVLICFVMVLGIAPTTAFASDVTEITEIKTIMPVDTVPKAGMEVDLFIPNVPDEEPYSRPWNGADWYDSKGVRIAPTVNHHYDLGYEFEAGHTYYADYQYTASDGYVFAENPIITLTGPDPSMFTYEIVDRWDNNRSVTVRYTFTIPGEFENADINKVSMMYYGFPKDGGKKPDRCNVIYNNCTITYEEWNTGTWGSDANWGVYEEDGSNAPTFLAGNTYVHMIELTAKDGYKFSEGLHVQKGTQDAEEYGVVSLSADRTVATVKFTYEIPEIEIINTIELMAANQHMYFCLRSSESIYLPQPFVPKYVLSAYCPYEVENVNSCDWINNETGEYLELGYPQTFENAKKYTLRFHVRIKDEYETTHKFASGTDLGLNVTDYAYANSNFVDFKVSGGGNTATVEVTFTVQFPEGAGSSANNPAFCYSYEEFKYAMENEDIRYVALGDVDDVLPSVQHDEEKEPGDITRTAIVVRGHKDLNLLGNAVFRCPVTGNYDLKYYIQLLTLTDVANSSLHIHGDGSLTYEGGTLYFVNSAITVEGGHLTVDGTTIRGSNGYHTGYCYGINARRGSVSIQNGATIIGEVYGGDDGICAMAVGEEGETRSLSVSIFDGKFYVERDTGDGSVDHGIAVWNDCGLRIYGMSSDGIELNRYAADTLSDYVVDGCMMTVDGVKTDPALCGTTNGYVEVYNQISKADIYVGTPVAGETVTVYPEDVYWVPDGCAVESIEWYENGELLNSLYAHTFEAGNTYRVEITLVADNGMRFANPLSSATISYKNAVVNAYGGDTENGIVMSVDFGVCPDTVNLVDLTVTAPKEGNKPIGAMGGSAGAAVWDTEWLVSDTGTDYQIMDFNDTFEADKYYKVRIMMKAVNGYVFPTYDDGISIMPDVSAVLNGYYADVKKTYGEDPSEYFDVEYDFGKCNDSVIDELVINNIVKPVAGECPSYTLSIVGSGYQSEGDYGFSRKNGIEWRDVTEGGSILYDDTKFIAGHTYEVTIYLHADEGYEFKTTTGSYITDTTATVNGNPATVVQNTNASKWQTVTCQFTCEKAEVLAIMIYDLDEPKGSNTPDTEVTSAYPLHYTVEGVTWVNADYLPLEENEKFESGASYGVEIVVKATDNANIAETVRAYIDGKEVSTFGAWDSVEVDSDTVTIRYYFRKPAPAPEIETEEYTYYYFPGEAEGSADFDVVTAGTEITLAECMFEAPEGKTFLGWAVGNINAELKQPGDKIVITGETYIYAIWNSYTISGTVKSFNDGDATIELIKDGEVLDFMDSDSEYSFSGLVEGTYTLKVSKTKHATREYEITVEGENVTQDVAIWLYGDVTCDGVVNAGDTLQINRKVANLSSVFNLAEDTDYRFKVANITNLVMGDAILNAADTLQINRKVANMSSIFDTIA